MRLLPKRTRRSTILDPRSGRKVWTMLNGSGYEVLTPWAAKQKRKRRAARKVAKQARKVNRRG